MSSKVEAIAKLSKAHLMQEDGCTPSVQRIKSGNDPLLPALHPKLLLHIFFLTAGQKRRTNVKAQAKAGTCRKRKPTDWTSECNDALSKLKKSLLHSVVLAHPNISLILILSNDASLDELGAVLSQIPAGKEFLALKWSVCEKFSHWIKGHTFNDGRTITCSQIHRETNHLVS